MMKQLVKKFTPRAVLDAYYESVEFLVAARYGFPGKQIKAIGVTGTKGKSTTVYLITRILEEAGLRVASTSSIEFRINNKSKLNTLKMGLLSRWKLQKFLAKAVRKNVDYVVIECTSEGLAQGRVDFVHFIAAVFTNLAPDHIEAHGSYEKYRKAKRHLLELLDNNGVAVINGDDKEAQYIASATKGRKIFFSLGDRHIQTPLLGEFNQYNALAAWTLCRDLGIDEPIVKKALMSINTIPGRLEEIKEGQHFRVFVDYAHNPSSLKAVLSSLYKLKTENSKFIIVTGATGGGRDTWKRPEMGKIAAYYSDTLILTTDDPYKDDPLAIIEGLYQGVLKTKNLKLKTILKIIDRKEAIKEALTLAQKDDIVVLLGKGSETVMETAQGKIPWNEKKIVSALLKTENSKLSVDLLSKKCVSCEGGTPPMSKEESQKYLSQVLGWEMIDEGKKITKEFKFKDFKQAMAFINKVALLAESEGHHPDIHIFYNRVKFELWTHAAKGLSENDFILAAKINNIS